MLEADNLELPISVWEHEQGAARVSMNKTAGTQYNKTAMASPQRTAPLTKDHTPSAKHHGMHWTNPFIKAVLMGTRDHASPLCALRAKPDMIELVFTKLKDQANSMDILAAAEKSALEPLTFACRYGTYCVEAQDTVPHRRRLPSSNWPMVGSRRCK